MMPYSQFDLPTRTSLRAVRILFGCCLAFFAIPASGQSLNNTGFEGGTLNAFPGYGPVQSWSTNTGQSGNNDASGPFNNGAPIREGSRVAFIQGAGAISQTVTGLEPGKNYTVHYLENERGLNAGVAPVAIGSASLGGQTVVSPHNVVRTDAYRRVQSDSFTATSTSHSLSLANNLGAAGDNTLLLDGVRVSRAVPKVINGGFEDYVLAPDSFQYAPNGQPNVGWSFVGGAGLSRNGSGFQGNPLSDPPSAVAAAIEGNQIGFLQGSSIMQTISGFELGASYSVSWFEQTRLNGGGSNDLAVYIDGVPVTSSHIVGNTSWAGQTSTDFIATSTSHTLEFRTTNPLGGDRTTFIDDVFFNFVDENDAPIAEANGAYVFDANNLTLALSAAGSSDPENMTLTSLWTDGGGTVATGDNPTISLADTNLAMTTSTEVITLTVTDPGNLSGTDTANVSYINAAVDVVTASGTSNLDGSIDFLGTFDDLDLLANALVANFEGLTWEFDTVAANSAGEVGDGFLTGTGTTGGGNVDALTLVGLFGGIGDYTAYANVRDKAGTIDTFAFNIMVVPEPSSLALMALGIVPVAAGIFRRRVKSH